MQTPLPALITLALTTGCAPLYAEPETLWYRQPATNWEKQALPIGNGRLGVTEVGVLPRAPGLDLVEHSDHPVVAGAILSRRPFRGLRVQREWDQKRSQGERHAGSLGSLVGRRGLCPTIRRDASPGCDRPTLT